MEGQNPESFRGCPTHLSAFFSHGQSRRSCCVPGKPYPLNFDLFRPKKQKLFHLTVRQTGQTKVIGEVAKKNYHKCFEINWFQNKPAFG
jgi:hypothetical protein